MTAELAGLARWYTAWIWDGIRQTWADLPGPTPVKVALVVACLLIPGPQDEIALIALTRLCRAWRRRQANHTALKGA